MMNLESIFGRMGSVLLLVTVMGVAARAQGLNSAASTITLTATVHESLTVTLSGSSVYFDLIAGRPINLGNSSIKATTTWRLQPKIGSVKLYAFFVSSVSAMTDGMGDNIPPADFQISTNGSPYSPMINIVPFGGTNTGMLLSTTHILGSSTTGSRTDVMTFNINLLNLPNLTPGNYTGTLTVQAQAI